MINIHKGLNPFFEIAILYRKYFILSPLVPGLNGEIVKLIEVWYNRKGLREENENGKDNHVRNRACYDIRLL